MTIREMSLRVSTVDVRTKVLQHICSTELVGVTFVARNTDDMM